MKGKIISFILLLVIQFKCCAQSSYFITFKNPASQERCYNIIEDSNGSILGVGVTCNEFSEINSYKGTVWQIAANSDTLTRYFTSGDTSYIFQYIEQRNNIYHIIATSFIPPEYSHTRIEHLVLDSALNVVSKSALADRNSFLLLGKQMRRINDCYYLLVSEEINYVGSDCILKLDSDFCPINFYVLWQKEVRTMDFLVSADSSQFWLFTNSYNLTPGPELIVLDTNMVVLEIKNFPRSNNVAYRDRLTAEWYTDSTFLIGCNHELSYNYFIGFSVLDSELEISPIQYFGSPDTTNGAAFKTTFSKSESSVFFCGIKNEIASFYPYAPSWIIAGKMTNNLQPEYVKYYGGDAYYWAYTIINTSEGGSVINLERYDYLTQDHERDVAFLKLNADGLITNSNNQQYQEPVKLFLYPNPTTSYINIKTDGLVCSRFEIYNSYGRLMNEYPISSSITRIDVSDLKPGIYLGQFIDLNNIRHLTKFIKF